MKPVTVEIALSRKAAEMARSSDSTSMAEFGASASCTKKILSAGISAEWPGNDARQRVEAVEDNAEMRVVGAPHDFPCLAVVATCSGPRPALHNPRASRAPQPARRARAKSAAARSMPPSERRNVAADQHQVGAPVPPSGRTCARLGRDSARVAARGMPSKSRNGWKAQMARPRSRHIWPTSRGLPLNESKSFSKISTASNPAAATARELFVQCAAQ